MQTVGNINIDFTISSTPKVLEVKDMSEWVYAENKPAYISVILPGSKKFKNFTFAKYQRNAFNSHNLGISCLSGDCKKEVYLDLPDGIYTICVKSSYQDLDKTNYYLKTDLFEIEFAKTIIKYGIEIKDEDFINHMVQIQGVITVAKSHAMLGDFSNAQRFFTQAKDMLKKYSDCKNCF